jgi:micrococcal nuclease
LWYDFFAQLKDVAQTTHSVAATVPKSPLFTASFLPTVMLAGFVSMTASAWAKEILPGPVPARVIKVLDGDTLEVEARIWLGQAMRIKVRLIGLDTPEKRSKCLAERQAAAAAQSYLQTQISDATVRLRNIHYGKYAGRVLARVDNLSGAELNQAMIAAGHGRVYAGGKRKPWCDAGGNLKP